MKASLNLFELPLRMHLHTRPTDHLVNRTEPFCGLSKFCFFRLLQIGLNLNLHCNISQHIVLAFPLPIIVKVVTALNPVPRDRSKFETLLLGDDAESCWFAGGHWWYIGFEGTGNVYSGIALVGKGNSKAFFYSYGRSLQVPESLHSIEFRD